MTNDGRQLAILCWGEGTPTVILESGGPGIEEWGNTTGFVRRLAAETRVCTYDRAGLGASDPAPFELRDADDLLSELKALLIAAAVDPPYVLVGWSFGGFTLTYYAHSYPDEVVGVVLLDVPAPNAEMTEANEPELVWDYPGNIQHLDVVHGFENRFALDPPEFGAPLIAIVATNGQSSVENQGFWLPLSPSSTLVELEGSHNIPNEQPAACAAEVLKLVEAARLTDS